MVDNPKEFPDPVVHRGNTGFLNIQSGDSFQECPGIISSSGMVYEFGQVIKDAIYGQVLVGVVVQPVNAELYARTETLVAVKKVSFQKMNELGVTFEDPMKEIAALQFLGNHPNIIQIFECISDDVDYYTMMEFCSSGSFSDLLALHKKFTESQSQVFFRHLVEGLQHMQSYGVCHRDLSLPNLVLSGDGFCKIIDFGMALRVPYTDSTEGVEFLLMPPQGACGKKNYMAPEVIVNTEPLNGFQVDVWALGVILFSFLVGRPPMSHASESDAHFCCIRDGKLTALIRYWKLDLSPRAVHFLQRLFQVEPARRLTLADILVDPWMTESIGHHL
jgi:serine/threonine protein kinase